MERDLNERARKKEQEEMFAREQERTARSEYVKRYVDIMQNPHKWPKGADAAASKIFMQIVQPGTKLKDVVKMDEEFMQGTARDKAADMLGLKRQQMQMSNTGNTMQHTATAPATGAGGFGIPMQAMGQMLGQMSQHLPDFVPKERVTGQLTDDELFGREIDQKRQELELENQFQIQYGRPHQVGSNEGGLSLLHPDGRLQKLTDPIPRRDTNTTPWETIANDPTLTQEQIRQKAEEFMRMQYTNQGDTPRPTGSSGHGNMFAGGMLVQDPATGNLQFVFPRILAANNPNLAQTGTVALPNNVQRPLSDTAKGDKAQLEMIINEMNGVEAALSDPDNPAYHNAVGLGNSVVFNFKKYVSLFGKNDEQSKAVRNSLYAGMSEELNRISGAAISPAEAARLKQALPNPNTTREQVLSDLKSFRSRLEFVLQRRFGPGGIGPSTGKFDKVDVFAGGLDMMERGTTAPPTGATRVQPPTTANVVPTRKAAPPSNVRIVKP